VAGRKKSVTQVCSIFGMWQSYRWMSDCVGYIRVRGMQVSREKAAHLNTGLQSWTVTEASVRNVISSMFLGDMVWMHYMSWPLCALLLFVVIIPIKSVTDVSTKEKHLLDTSLQFWY